MAKAFVFDHDKRDSSKQVETQDKPIGACPDGRVPVIRANGLRAGHVGPNAGPSVAQRLGVGNVELGEHFGKPAWLEKQVKQTTPARASVLDRGASLAAAKGSATSTPSAPKTTARPKR
jgi:hypothetical protein